MNQEVFVIVGKKPTPGFSKTRLSQDIGEERALLLSEAFLKDFLSALKKNQKNRKILFYGYSLDSDGENYFRNISREVGIQNFHYREQGRGDLLQRLQDIFKEIETQYQNPFIHLTGTDIPDFPFSHLEKIDLSKINIGPDRDGGYYYIGAKASDYGLFDLSQNLESRPNLYEKTLERIKELKRDIQVLSQWSDIDILRDLENCLKRSSKELIPHTHQAFFTS